MRTIFVIIILILASPSFAEVHVQPKVTYTSNGSYKIGPRRGTSFSLGDSRLGDKFQIAIIISNNNDLTAYVVDQANFDLKNQNKKYKYVGVTKGVPQININTEAWSNSRYFLVLDNSYNNDLEKQLVYQIKTIKTLPDSSVKQITDFFQSNYDLWKYMYVFMPFNINCIQCGQENAFSNHDITICSEIVTRLSQDDLLEAISPILSHELGHTLLRSWGLPGWDNEELVDEFAVVLMLRMGKHGEKSINKLIGWLTNKNINNELEAIIFRGDRHPLSIQRIRNMQRIIKSPSDVVSRWNKLLYSFMTNQYLKDIISNSTNLDNPELAKQTLAARKY